MQLVPARRLPVRREPLEVQMAPSDGGRSVEAVFAGPGEVRRICRSIDWSATPLGPVESWPPALRGTVRLAMSSPTPMAIWIGPEFGLVYNEGYAPVLGRKHPGAMGRPAREVWAEVWHAIGPEFQQVLDTGVSIRHEEAPFVLRRNGREEEAYFTYTFTPIREDDGRVLGLLNICEETTKVVRARTESERFLAFALEAARIGAWELDLADHTAERSPEHDRIFGYEQPLPSWNYETFLEHVVPEDRPEVERRFRLATEGRGDWAFECRIRTKAGEIRWIGAAGRHRLDESGRRARMAGIVQDVTQRKQAEEALREANERLQEDDRRKNEFLAVLSHELRNPLAPIRNSIHLLERAEAGSEQARGAREVLHRQTEHLTRLVDDLLDMTRISRGKIELKRARLDLRDVVRRAADDLRSLFEEGTVVLRVEQAPGPVWVEGDATRLSQVLGNLIQNAAKFTPPGGAVTVALSADGSRATLAVRDTGAGIEPGEVERMFEPFAQGAQDIARTKGGLGLGLALVKGLVELHGGSVRASSAGIGRGSEFVVTLPVVEAEPTAARPGGPARSTRSRLVLIVEDNVDAGRTLSDILELAGHRVSVALDARTGLAMAREARPDVIICDIGLPDMDGYEFARAARQDDLLRGARLIALTGYALPEDRQRAAEAGFDAHLPKPPSLDELEALLAG